MVIGPKALGRKRGDLSPANIREIIEWANGLKGVYGDDFSEAQAEVFSMLSEGDPKYAGRRLANYVAGLEETLKNSKKRVRKVWDIKIEGYKVDGNMIADMKSAFLPLRKNGMRALASVNLSNGDSMWNKAERCRQMDPLSSSTNTVFVKKDSSKKGWSLMSYEKKKGRSVGSLTKSDVDGLGDVYDALCSRDDSFIFGFSKGIGAFDWKLGFKWDTKLKENLADVLWAEGDDALFSSDSGVYRINLGDGVVHWKNEMSLSSLGSWLKDDLLYLQSSEMIYALDPGSGEIKWSFKADADLTGVLKTNGKVLKASGNMPDQGWVEYELNPRSGKLLSEKVFEGETRYAFTQSEKDISVRNAMGKLEMEVSKKGTDNVLWKRKVDDIRPFVHNGHVFLKEDGWLYVLSSENGQELGSLEANTVDLSILSYGKNSFLLYNLGGNELKRYDLA